MKHTANNPVDKTDNYCKVIEQKHLVEEMTECDVSEDSYEKKVECYTKATKESQENSACMYS
ncbi:MAG: hypothetical protein ABIJ31_06955 [Pseudomonadota bacterium]